ncbi:EscU/YscU/HrcU family type III secretion system export apparatus switch protein [Acidisarcina polymorpha]|uniref:EscU/YscU/HrcU family type III secretion system export apparatus switch protein n=1 Tax=Acidisarcina polymorpha TaxID=2211140 RepID=UPI000DEFEF91|nr:EscU/YscU/HrcU family type III secretion system export apparatus switch protein [Acidisarcina polymorpha]
MAGERTEQASPRRRQKAREQGDSPHSRELLAASVTLAGSLTLGAIAPAWLTGWMSAFQRLMGMAETPAWRGKGGIAAVLELRGASVAVMLPVISVMLACVGAALTAGIIQGGGVRFFAPVLQPKWTRLDPIANLKNLFSLRSGARLFKTLLPVAVLSVLAWGQLMHQAEFPVFSVARMPEVMGGAYALLVNAAWILCVWSAVDF